MIKVTTGSGRWQPFCDLIERFLEADTVELGIEGEIVRGYRSPDSPALWVRDHSDILRAGRFFASDVKSAVNAFAETQSQSGRVFDYVLTKPSEWAGERENWEKWVRVPVEADVEYRFVKAGFLAWQASGDHEWMRRMLPAFERALVYSTTHPVRHDPASGLVKRAYTMDTWDFDYTAGRHPWLNFQITDHTFWGIMHGDNSGVFESARLLATMYDHSGDRERADNWRASADHIRETANRLLFNGRFYTHFHKLSEFDVDGVDESEQLSLSNPMAITRGMATPEIAQSVLAEYQRRRRDGTSFAEWFSIDPPFPTGFFGEEKLVPGAYVNGGIMPLVGGELALAAFENGCEEYGLATLEQYRNLIIETGETFLWYFPDGTPSTVDTSTSPEAMPTDGWGSSSMLNAFVQGLCGVHDRASCFSDVVLAPRWYAAGEARAEVELSYPASDSNFGYTYFQNETASAIELHVSGSQEKSKLSVCLTAPAGRTPERLEIDGSDVEFRMVEANGAQRAAADIEVNRRVVVKMGYR